MAGAPPPYGGPRKKSNTTNVVLIVLGVCAACCILGVIGTAAAGYFGFKKIKDTVACTLGFQQAADAMQDYVDDHNGKLPPAATWQDAIRPYFAKQQQKSENNDGSKMFGSFDPNGAWECKDDSAPPRITGIAFNSDLSGKELATIKNKSTTIILFEVPKSGTNLNMAYTELTESSSPRIMNSPRGWLKVDANLEIDGGSHKRTIRVSSSSSDSRDKDNTDDN